MAQTAKNPKSLQQKSAIVVVIIALVIVTTISVVVIANTVKPHEICGGTLPLPSTHIPTFERPETPFDIVNDVEGVTVDIKESTVSKDGLTIILKNTTPQKYMFDGLPVFMVEEKINDKWYTIPHITSDRFDYAVWTDILDEYSTKEAEIWWSSWYGELSSGNYRILQHIQLYPGSRWPEPTPMYYITAEFTIK
jgi:hypothetical protein